MLDLFETTEKFMKRKAEIIDNFVEMFIIDREDYFKKHKKIDFKRIELIETRESPKITKWSIRLRKGKLKK